MPGEKLNLKEKIGKYKISTVDLGEFALKHPEMMGAYETMIFNDVEEEDIDYQVRYETEEEARKGHQEAIDFIKNKKNLKKKPKEKLSLNNCIGRYEISTVEQGDFPIKHSKPYKTTVFRNGKEIGSPIRYKTEEEARKGHQIAVEYYKPKK